MEKEIEKEVEKKVEKLVMLGLETLPLLVYENSENRHERKEKRLISIVLGLIVAIMATNAIWLWGWFSYDYIYEETVYTQDGAGTNIIGDENEVKLNGSEID